ncbi:hypothetical protein U9M48_001160 [Paspalum notatum var. saurae]|uniref:Uncharacterized protein n=1 Tax=Paspalum notatum var. saurae TaxID=547442 RepID=A0AAQ3PNT5_PASNO
MHIDHGIEEPTQSDQRSRSPRTRSRTRGKRISGKPPTPLPTTLTLARKVLFGTLLH